MPGYPETLSVPLFARKPLEVDFQGGDLSSDAGFLVLALADQKLGLCDRLAAAITDARSPRQIDYPLPELLRERVFLIGAGYPDANDANALRGDPALKTVVGRAPDGPPLAGQSTLSRLENAATPADLFRLGAALLDTFVTQISRAGTPQRLVLDFDPFEDPAHGAQQGVLFNGYYDSHCYLPLYLCGQADGGRQYVIGALLRDGGASPVEGARWMLKKAVAAVRQRHPDVEIIVRGDGGYGVPAMIECCRQLRVKFCFGKPQNARLLALAERTQLRAALGYTIRHRRDGAAAKSYRACSEFEYQAQTWKQAERVIAKAEVTEGAGGCLKLNPRFVVTNLEAKDGWTPKGVYHFYCQRGDAPENRIKEFKDDLEADRLSCHRATANQFRLLLHTAAYMLYQTVQDALAAVAPETEWAQAQVGTIRAKLVKIAVRVIQRCRLIRLQLPRSYRWPALWLQLLAALQPAAG
jgi:Transposase DDE domain group 1